MMDPVGINDEETLLEYGSCGEEEKSESHNEFGIGF